MTKLTWADISVGETVLVEFIASPESSSPRTGHEGCCGTKFDTPIVQRLIQKTHIHYRGEFVYRLGLNPLACESVDEVSDGTVIASRQAAVYIDDEPWNLDHGDVLLAPDQPVQRIELEALYHHVVDDDVPKQEFMTRPIPAVVEQVEVASQHAGSLQPSVAPRVAPLVPESAYATACTIFADIATDGGAFALPVVSRHVRLWSDHLHLDAADIADGVMTCREKLASQLLETALDAVITWATYNDVTVGEVTEAMFPGYAPLFRDA